MGRAKKAEPKQKAELFIKIPNDSRHVKMGEVEAIDPLIDAVKRRGGRQKKVVPDQADDSGGFSGVKALKNKPMEPLIKRPRKFSPKKEYGEIDPGLFEVKIGGLKPYEVYSKFANKYSNTDRMPLSSVSDSEIGQALIVTQGYIGAIALYYGVSALDLKARIAETAVLRAIWETLRECHIDTGEKAINDAAAAGEAWAAKIKVTNKFARDRGYVLDKEEVKGAEDIASILNIRIAALEAEPPKPVIDAEVSVGG